MNIHQVRKILQDVLDEKFVGTNELRKGIKTLDEIIDFWGIKE